MRCHTSISKILGLACLGILMLGVSWFCTTLPNLKAQIVGWTGSVFFGLCFIAILAQLFRSGPSVIVDEIGIHDLRSSTFGIIQWSDIVSLWIGSVSSARFLCVEVLDPSIYLLRLPSHKRLLAKTNPSLGFPLITISFSGLSPGLGEVWGYIQSSHPEKIGSFGQARG
ncbi:MAG: hypothetical protein K1X66_09390 [Verrucomicrobiae bacterium]|nr:hypothetical protein [Verrucomicrobiae bacterium]